MAAPVKDEASLYIRFGGAGRWKLGDPEGAKSLSPHTRFTFGQTRYKVIEGTLNAAFYDYRKHLESNGYTLPANYNPPVHWNEFYDNRYWWNVNLVNDYHSDYSAQQESFYTLKDIEREAASAHEYGCECLYLDPGWDTEFSSNIWDEKRLGKAKRIR